MQGVGRALSPRVKERRPQTTDSVPEVAVYAVMGCAEEFR